MNALHSVTALFVFDHPFFPPEVSRYYNPFVKVLGNHERPIIKGADGLDAITSAMLECFLLFQSSEPCTHLSLQPWSEA